MKTLLLACLFCLSGCAQVFANQYDDEQMYDLASRLKDVTQRLDGYLKFSDAHGISEEEILDKADAKKLLQTYFSNFEVIVQIQGNDVVLLLCDDTVALVEDAGCNAKIDVHHWRTPVSNSCKITLLASNVCS